MPSPKNQLQSNIIPLATGLLLIIFVVGVFFLKLNYKEKNEVDLSEKNSIREDIKNLKSISAQDFFKKINAKEKFILLDLRSPKDFDQEHIIDSINAPAGNLDSIEINLAKDQTYYLIDDIGLTPNEIELIKNMNDLGASNVSYLEGGFLEWKNQLYPTVSAGDPYSFTDQSKVIYIKSAELKNVLSQKSNIFLIDLRDKNAFSQEHLPGAINIPLSTLEKRRKEIPFGKSIILYDDNGYLSFQGAVRLFDMGVFNVHALSDGLAGWKKNGLETSINSNE